MARKGWGPEARAASAASRRRKAGSKINRLKLAREIKSARFIVKMTGLRTAHSQKVVMGYSKRITAMRKRFGIPKRRTFI